MAKSSKALLRVVTGHGIIPRPAWLERLLTALDRDTPVLDLKRISDRQLRDLGLDRSEVLAEMQRTPEWDAPQHWHRA
ncbi:hypothetical protein [Paracoccus spongiarum]|uniref:DUF1127 domain-containing protein n=1 Tax=Paracoccus spongiarum TaxID=3064387 RepID=A0ABT9J898_9RHOB|nr:hypothetical protein [Paracoccus sp. 2205BS29-5]MDP5306048.1 hypothetical protein [Paracoccus sp. 2205BS29-5]